MPDFTDEELQCKREAGVGHEFRPGSCLHLVLCSSLLFPVAPAASSTHPVSFLGNIFVGPDRGISVQEQFLDPS